MRAIVLLLAVLAGVVGSPAAADEDAPASPVSFVRAQIQLTARLEAADIGAVPPLLSNPEDAALLRTAFDPRTLQLMPFTGLGEGLNICDVANRYNVTLGFVGSRKDEFKGAPPEEAAATILRRTTTNLVKYQDEMALSLRFSAACMARLVKPAADFWAALPESQRTPVRLQGLRQIRNGMTGIYTGIIITQGDVSIREPNRLLLIDSLLDSNADLGQGLSPEGRRKVLDAIEATLASSSTAGRARLARLRDELTGLPCLQLCAI